MSTQLNRLRQLQEELHQAVQEIPSATDTYALEEHLLAMLELIHRLREAGKE